MKQSLEFLKKLLKSARFLVYFSSKFTILSVYLYKHNIQNMSKYVSELIKDIKDNPTSWVDYHGEGIQKGDVIIYNYGNTRFLSVISILIKEKDIPATYIDLWRLEVTIKNWYKIIGLKNLIDDKI